MKDIGYIAKQLKLRHAESILNEYIEYRDEDISRIISHNDIGNFQK